VDPKKKEKKGVNMSYTCSCILLSKNKISIKIQGFFVGRKSCLFKQLLVLGHYFANVLQFGHFSKNVTPINVLN
jgi:hypothetical protein